MLNLCQMILCMQCPCSALCMCILWSLCKLRSLATLEQYESLEQHVFKCSFYINGGTQKVLKFHAPISETSTYNLSFFWQLHFISILKIWNFKTMTVSLILCAESYFVNLFSASLCRLYLELSKVCFSHGQTLAYRTNPGPSFQP